MDQDNVYTADQARDLSEQLCAMTDTWHPWRWTRARKDHTDWFGDCIKGGEEYLGRDCGPGFGDRVRLSARSADRFLSALFLGNPVFAALAERAKQVRDKRMAEMMRKALKATESMCSGGRGGTDEGDDSQP